MLLSSVSWRVRNNPLRLHSPIHTRSYCTSASETDGADVQFRFRTFAIKARSTDLDRLPYNYDCAGDTGFTGCMCTTTVAKRILASIYRQHRYNARYRYIESYRISATQYQFFRYIVMPNFCSCNAVGLGQSTGLVVVPYWLFLSDYLDQNNRSKQKSDTIVLHF